MSSSYSNLTSGSGGSQTSYTTGTFSAPSGQLLLLSVGSDCGNVGPNTPTPSGLGVTWSVIGTKGDFDGHRKISVFRGISYTPPVVGSLLLDFGGQAQSAGAEWSIDAVKNINITDQNGANAILQAGSANEGSGVSVGTLGVTLGGVSAGTNSVYAALFLNGTAAVTPGSGFSQVGFDNAVRTLQTEVFTGAIGSANWSWAPNLRACGIAVEIGFGLQSGFLGKAW